MKIKDIFKIIRHLKGADGCIVIRKVDYGVISTRFGNFSDEDQIKYLGDMFSNN